MRLLITAIGRAKDGPETMLTRNYLRRLPWKTEIKEIELKKEVVDRRAAETGLLLEACSDMDRIIALDEQGETLTSADFAKKIGRWQEQGTSSLGIIIGGADGLDRTQLKNIFTLSFGRLTWPHMLVRPMLAEQLYRAYTLLSNHPYHRQ